MKLYRKLTNDFTVVSNEIFRYGLSLKAIGIYAYLVNKPDEWEFSVLGIVKQTSDGRDSIASGINELEQAGFLERVQKRDKGKFVKNDWVITDKPKKHQAKNGKSAQKSTKPTETPSAENPSSEKPSAENTAQVNTILVNTKLSKEDRYRDVEKQLVLKEEYKQWLGEYNKLTNSEYRSDKDINNFAFFRKTYSLEEMLRALQFLPRHDWLSDKHTPTLILRQRDRTGEPADRIGELLTLAKRESLKKFRRPDAEY